MRKKADDDIEAIPTSYWGVDMKSRLEARVAGTLNRGDVWWEYEPEQYELRNGELYTPDFLLPDYRMILEVKPHLHDPRIPKTARLAEQLAPDDVPVYLLYPLYSQLFYGEGDLLLPIRMRGLREHEDAVFVLCPACGALTPECSIGVRMLRCCGLALDVAEAARTCENVLAGLWLPNYQETSRSDYGTLWEYLMADPMVFETDRRGVTSDELAELMKAMVNVIDTRDPTETGWVREWMREREYEALESPFMTTWLGPGWR